MKSSQGSKTTAQNLEEKFDRGGDVLDYFDFESTRGSSAIEEYG